MSSIISLASPVVSGNVFTAERLHVRMLTYVCMVCHQTAEWHAVYSSIKALQPNDLHVLHFQLVDQSRTANMIHRSDSESQTLGTMDH